MVDFKVVDIYLWYNFQGRYVKKNNQVISIVSWSKGVQTRNEIILKDVGKEWVGGGNR